MIEFGNVATPTEAATTDETANDMKVKRWLETRKQAGFAIDAETAEVMWTYAYVVDPYGVYPDLAEECQCVGREHFACSPGTDIWVWFGDLPDETREKIWERLHAEATSEEELPF